MCLVSTEATESFGPAGWHWLYSISSGFGIVFHVVIALLLQASFCLFCLTVGLTLRCNPISYCWQKCLNNSQRAETMFTVVHMQCVLSNDYSCTPWIVSPDYKINYRKQVWSDQRLFLILPPLSFDPPTQHWWTTTCWTVSSVQKQSWQGQCMRPLRAAPLRSVAMATVWQSTASRWCWRRTSSPPTASSTSSTGCSSPTQVNPTPPTLNANICSSYLASVIISMSSLFDPCQPRMGWRWWDSLRALSAIWCQNWDWLPFWVRKRSTRSLLLSTMPSRVSWFLIEFWLASDWHSDSTSGENVQEKFVSCLSQFKIYHFSVCLSEEVMSTDQSVLKYILENHILKLKVTLSELYNGQLLETLAGKLLRVFIYRTVRAMYVCVCVFVSVFASESNGIREELGGEA